MAQAAPCGYLGHPASGVLDGGIGGEHGWWHQQKAALGIRRCERKGGRSHGEDRVGHEDLPELDCGRLES